MKIIHLIPELWNGGAEKFAIDLCSKLSVTENVILCSFKDVKDGMLFVENISPEVKLVTLSKKKGFDIKFCYRLLKLLSKEKPDVIHTHLTAIKYCFFPLIILKNIQAFHTIHSTPDYEEKNRLYRMIKRIYFASKRIIPITLTERTSKVFFNVYKSKKTEIIYNGVKKRTISLDNNKVQNEINSYKYDNNTKVFLTVGSYTRKKNYQLLINTFKRLYSENKNVILLIIGNDTSSDNGEWKKLEMMKSENTFMLGLKSNVQDYMKNSDCFCLSSLIEGMPITILEAYSAGLPVISTPAGGVPDILEPFHNGLLSADFSGESYYNTFEKFLNLSEGSIKKIKENNKKIFNEKFTIEESVKNHLKCYKKYA